MSDKMGFFELAAFSLAVICIQGLILIFGVCRAIYEVGHFYLTGKEA